jgi:ornithine aminotransferase
MTRTEELIALESEWGAHNYSPLDVVICRAEGCWVYDVEGKKYLDCLSSYSALNMGHRHPRIIGALVEQSKLLTLTSRAFRNDQLPLFCKAVAEMCEMEMVLPMNTGAEAVETAIKVARRWGYQCKGIAEGQAEIIAFSNNFHGRTTTIVGFASEPSYRKGFGPFPAGFKLVPFGDIAALRAQVTKNTCAILLEPIQCEGGVIFPPEGFLRDVRELCDETQTLMIADEIQTALGRTGEMFACDHERVRPDIYLLGKALGGGVLPISAVVSSAEILGVLTPGSHGSTFGGNPLACAVALESLAVLRDENLPERSRELGAWFTEQVRAIPSTRVAEVRGRGLLLGIQLKEPARAYCERLAAAGMLCKETHEFVLRVMPPLIVKREELEFALARLKEVLCLDPRGES